MDERLAPYVARWKREEAAELAEAARLREKALPLAKRLARVLVEEFGARRVVLVGSLARGDFSLESDIDLVVEGLPARQFFYACARVDELGEPFRVDLIALEDANPLMQRRVVEEGQVLHEQA